MSGPEHDHPADAAAEAVIDEVSGAHSEIDLGVLAEAVHGMADRWRQMEAWPEGTGSDGIQPTIYACTACGRTSGVVRCDPDLARHNGFTVAHCKHCDGVRTKRVFALDAPQEPGDSHWLDKTQLELDEWLEERVPGATPHTCAGHVAVEGGELLDHHVKAAEYDGNDYAHVDYEEAQLEVGDVFVSALSYCNLMGFWARETIEKARGKNDDPDDPGGPPMPEGGR